MIPKRCYDDIRELKKRLSKVCIDFGKDKTVVSTLLAVIHSLDDITRKWTISDDAEMDDMYEEFEKSEKDAMWDRD